jgi:hypothetical protein
MGGQASWLLPASLLALGVGLWSSRRAPRTDRTRAAMILWGGWLLVSAAVFSFSSGVIHTYYAVALAPAIAALVAITASALWRERHKPSARLLMAPGVVVTAGWAYVLLDRTPSWEPWLRPLILAGAALGILWLLAGPSLKLGRRASVACGTLAVVACLAGPLAYSAQTITTPHTGSIPSAGPASAGAGGPGGPGGTGGFPGGPGRGAQGGPAGGGSSAALGRGSSPGGLGSGAGGGSSAAFGRGASPRGSGSGPGGGASLSSALVKTLESGAGHYRWVAAVSGSQTAASIELASGGDPVMAIGGFNDNGGNLTLAAFESYVQNGEIHYYLSSGSAGQPGGPGRGTSSSSSISSWVKAHYKAVTVGGQTIYDLTKAA